MTEPRRFGKYSKVIRELEDAIQTLCQQMERIVAEKDAETARKIAEMSSDVDNDPAIPSGDTQWRKGYKQACSDIIAALSRS